MDQNRAKKLFEEGAIFIFLDVPIGTEFGIDTKSWSTGEKFRGVKMIPPGNHFIHYRAGSDTEDIGPKSGFFHEFHQGEILVKKWDPAKEDLSSEEISDTMITNFRHNIKALDSFLAPYPYDIHEEWMRLTRNLTGDLMKQLVPICGIVRTSLEILECPDAEGLTSDAGKPISDAERPTRNKFWKSREMKRVPISIGGDFDVDDDSSLRFLKVEEFTKLRFTQFPDKHYPEGSTPSEITKHSLDSSYVLEKMICQYEKPTDIIGELEFSFICFLFGESVEALLQWKKLIKLLCSSESAITKYRKLYSTFMDVLELQIVTIPEEFIGYLVLYVRMKELFRNIESSGLDEQFRSKMERFKDFLTKTYGWKFSHLELDDEEDAPVVVELS